MNGHWKEHIDVINGFPKPEVIFYDVSTLLANAEMRKKCIDQWISELNQFPTFDKIAVVDSRGFLFGSFLAERLGKGVILVRKKGKLPPETISHKYTLEYGEAELEVRPKTISKGEKVLVVDDLLATGGTLGATIHLLKKAGAEVVGASCLMRITHLFSGDNINGVKVHNLFDI